MQDNTKSPIAALIKQLREGDIDQKKEAALALSQFGYDAAEAASDLVALLGSPDVQARKLAALALGEAGSPLAINPLIVALGDEEESVQHRAEVALKELGRVTPEVVSILMDAFERESLIVRRRIRRVIWHLLPDQSAA
jgi:HEAT repeat protein